MTRKIKTILVDDDEEYGVLGIFRPKTTKNAEATAPQASKRVLLFLNRQIALD
jgi:hypothetical protein